MPHFVFESDGDETIIRILKDGKPYDGQVKLEQAFSVVTIYFKLAAENLVELEKQTICDKRRWFGIQSFLMGLTGLEAFTNTYFHLRAEELGNEAILKRISQTHGSLSKKILDLVALTAGGPLCGQDQLLDQIFKLSQLRNDLLHPRWKPSGVTITGEVPVTILGLVENPQAMFEDELLCRESLLWCLLTVARVGQACGLRKLDGFLFHWTGNYGLTLNKLIESLGLPSEECAPTPPPASNSA